MRDGLYVFTSKGLSENHIGGLCQMTGNEAWHKHDVCLVSTLSKSSEVGLQHLWTNTNKINPVAKGHGHAQQRRDWGWGGGNNQKKKGGVVVGEEERTERNKRKH